MKKAAHSGFETQRRCHQKSETGVSVAPKMNMCPPKILKEMSGHKFYKGSDYTNFKYDNPTDPWVLRLLLWIVIGRSSCVCAAPALHYCGYPNNDHWYVFFSVNVA